MLIILKLRDWLVCQSVRGAERSEMEVQGMGVAGGGAGQIGLGRTLLCAASGQEAGQHCEHKQGSYLLMMNSHIDLEG
jgi:hypothetical protein